MKLIQALKYKNITIMDIVQYISRFIPPTITVADITYQFQIFINHAHYDIRFCYYNEYKKGKADRFKYLVENINSDKSLMDELKELRLQLRSDGLLDGDYATPEGYTVAKYKKWITKGQ